jgi:hypothetical protein
MPPKRSRDHTPREEGAVETEVKHTTVVMSVQQSIKNASSIFAEGSFRPVNAVKESLFNEVQRQVDANARVGVLASWFLNIFLAWLSDEYITLWLGPIDQNFCTAAANLCNNTGNARTGSGQLPLKWCFDYIFEPLFSADFQWPRHLRSGNLFNALGREMATNYENYMTGTKGFEAHAVRHLMVEAGVPRWQAKQAWERANRQRPAAPGPLTFADHQRNFHDPADTLVKEMADQLVARARLHPLLAHRFLLNRVEQRQAQAQACRTIAISLLVLCLIKIPLLQAQAEEDDEATTGRTGKLFPLFPEKTIRTPFATLDVKVIKQWLSDENIHTTIDKEDLLKAFFPRLKGVCVVSSLSVLSLTRIPFIPFLQVVGHPQRRSRLMEFVSH